MKDLARPGSRRYGNPLRVQDADSRPVMGREVINPDVPRTAPWIVRQPDPKHPGGIPAKNMAATAAARPAADPVVHHTRKSGIPIHRSEPMHKQPKSEETTLI